MSVKVLSLGSVAAAVRGITVSAASNATPIVLTLGAAHFLKNTDRLALAGITGNTAANGEWTLGSVGATAATLLGSVGNGAFGGTAVAAVVCDTTPLMRGHTAAVVIGQTPGQAALVGTVVIEGADSVDATQFYNTVAGVATAGFASALPAGALAIPAATAGMGYTLEVAMRKYMTLRCSAYTSGGANAQLLA
jgi:hypothetical protein